MLSVKITLVIFAQQLPCPFRGRYHNYLLLTRLFMQKGDHTGLPKAIKYICSFEMGMLQSVGEQRRGQVAVAGIRQQRYDGLALVLRTLCKLDRSPDSRTAGSKLACLCRTRQDS